MSLDNASDSRACERCGDLMVLDETELYVGAPLCLACAERISLRPARAGDLERLRWVAFALGAVGVNVSLGVLLLTFESSNALLVIANGIFIGGYVARAAFDALLNCAPGLSLLRASLLRQVGLPATPRWQRCEVSAGGKAIILPALARLDAGGVCIVGDGAAVFLFAWHIVEATIPVGTEELHLRCPPEYEFAAQSQTDTLVVTGLRDPEGELSALTSLTWQPGAPEDGG